MNADQVLSAKTPRELFGTGDTKDAYRELSRKFHPDLCSDPRARAIQAHINALYDEACRPKPKGVTVATKKALYKFEPELFASGDLCDVYSGDYSSLESGATLPAVIKVARDPRDRDLLAEEQKILQEFWTAIEANADLAFFGHTLPRPLGLFSLVTAAGERPASALKRIEGYTTDKLRELFPDGMDPVQVSWMLTRLLTTLAATHKQGRIHGAVLPHHLLVRWDNTKGHRHAKVLDWTASVKIGEKLKVFFPKHVLFYPPEAFNKHPATAATDLFMFGQTASFLLGGDLSSRKVPKTVPGPLRGAIQSCLIPSTNRRPEDTAEFLFEVFRPALAEIWGSPKYTPFTLPTDSRGTSAPI